MATEYFNDAWRIPNNKNQSLVSNYSMEFDNVSNVNLGNAFEGTNEGFTISFWYNTSINQTNHIISKTSNNFEIYSFADLTLYTYFGSISKNTNRIPVVLNSWQHICYVVTSTEYKGYQNGVLTVTNAFTQTPVYTNNTSDIFLSSRAGGVSSWSGKLDQTCFFDYALPATGTNSVATLYGGGTAVTNPMALSPAPVAYYQLGDQSVSTGPSSDYLVPNNSLQDYVFDFPTRGDVHNVGVSNKANVFDNATNFSFSGWFKIEDLQNSNIFEIKEGNNYRFNINYYTPLNGQIRFNVNSSASGAFSYRQQANTFVSDWFHYAGIFDGNGASNTDKFKLYINGSPVILSFSGTLPTNMGSLSGNNTINLGNTISPTFQSFDGKASSIQMWNTSLLQSEVETLYNNGTPYTSTPPQSSNLQFWYKLNAQDTFDGTNWTIKDYGLVGADLTSVGMTSANLVQSNLQHTSGYSPYALTLDSNDANWFKLGTPNESTLGGSTSFTVTAWVKPIDNSQLQYIFGSWGGGNTTKSYFLSILATDKIRFQFISQNDGSQTTLTTPNIGINYDVWQNITVTYDATDLKIFVNGVERASIESIGKVVYNSVYADSIARSSSVSYSGYFNGDISNCAIWRNSVINPVTIYNNGVPANLNNLSTKPSYWWQLGSNSSFDANTSKWTCLNEGTERTDAAPVDAITGIGNMTNDDITNGVGYSANGLGTSSIEIFGDAPYSTANGLSENMDVLDRTTDVPS